MDHEVQPHAGINEGSQDIQLQSMTFSLDGDLEVAGKTFMEELLVS